jgi:hypothetical protein
MVGRFESNDSSADELPRQDSNKNSIKSIAIRFVLSSAAATVAETGSILNLICFFILYLNFIFDAFNLVTYPLDILKTRLQIQNELQKVKHLDNSKLPHGMFGMAMNMSNLSYFILFIMHTKF